MAACADTFLSVCRLNKGVQFHCNRVSVPFLQDKQEALVDYFLCYLERDIREFRSVTSDTIDERRHFLTVVSNAHAIKFSPAALHLSA
jgi:hypothetical protein